MSRLELFVLDKNKNFPFAVAVGKLENSILETVKDDVRSAVFSLVSEFEKQGIKFSEIILSGTKNYFQETPLEKRVTVLKKPELFFPDFVELKRHASRARAAARRAASGEAGFFSGTPGGYDRGQRRRSPVTTGAKDAGPRKKQPTASERITSKALGDRAETLVAEFLVREGHKILARNHKTRFYEIDIVSTKGDKIYFTEVKYRKNALRGSSLDMITKEKLSKMTFAANAFLKSRPDLKAEFSPLLAAASVSGDDFVLNDWFILS